MDISNILLSAEVLADQYRSLLISRASFCTPLPATENSRIVEIAQLRSPQQQKSMPIANLEKSLPPRPKTLRRVRSQHSLRKQILLEEKESWFFDSVFPYTVKPDCHSQSWWHPQESTRDSFSDAETAVDFDFQEDNPTIIFSPPPTNAVYASEPTPIFNLNTQLSVASLRAPTPVPIPHLRPLQHQNLLSQRNSNARLSASVDILTSSLSAVLETSRSQSYSPVPSHAPSMASISVADQKSLAGKNEVQIRRLIEAYEGLKEELNKGLSGSSEMGEGCDALMVSEEVEREVRSMNGIVEVWLEALRGVGKS
jgi:hypothetical protein